VNWHSGGALALLMDGN